MKKLIKKVKATITTLRLNEDDWWLIIHSSADGYVLETNDGDLIPLGSKKDDEIIADEDLLWTIIDFFGMRDSRYERERLSIIRERGDKYFLQPGETIKKEYYEVVVKIKEK